MTRVRKTVVLLASLLLVLPTAAASDHVEQGTTTTGKTDLYGEGPLELGPCLGVIVDWEITLELENPHPADRVRLTVKDGTTVETGTATGQDPNVTIEITTTDGCRPMTAVTGVLVVGFTDYTLTFDTV